MTTRDVSYGEVIKLYDDYQTQWLQKTLKLTEKVRMEHLGIKEIDCKRKVIERLQVEDPKQYRLLRSNLDARRPEPRRSSPLDQIGWRTASLDPMGELTGGNFGAGF
jgi:hypothetical protein